MSEHTLADENAADVSAAFDLLSNARRRGVLYAAERDEPITVDELARTIATWLADGERDADFERVRTSLVHAHLPKLADAGVVDYDRDDQTVTLADDATDLERYLASTRESESSSPRARHSPGLA